MIEFDISKNTFDERNHYSGVRMQQGRVMIDSDFNEHEQIHAHVERESWIDIIGPFGSPDQGFRISNLRIENGLVDFDILPGTLYLGGTRLDMEPVEQEPSLQFESFRTQKDYLQLATDAYPIPILEDGQERFDLVYIHAWQQGVSAVEDGQLYEVALGGADTCSRVRNMRRVEVAADIGFSECETAWEQLKVNWEDTHQGLVDVDYELVPNVALRVSYSEDSEVDDLCAPDIEGGYLGAENQAIRVQVTGPNHLTWGFDNASPLYKVIVSGNQVEFVNPPKDVHHWPRVGQSVEILPWSALLSNGEKVAALGGHFSRVGSSYNPETGLEIETVLPPGFGEISQAHTDTYELFEQDPAEYFYLRVWNRGSDTSSDPEIFFDLATSFPLALGNTGVEISLTGEDMRAGDYWIIGVRPETPRQVHPWRLEEGMAPHGIRRYHAPLAIIQWRMEGDEMVGEIIRDCRKTFRPLTDQESCCTYHVGDGRSSFGDFDSIEEAIRNLPIEGGEICVLPGNHLANVNLSGCQNIRITGCGERTIVRPHLERAEEPIFHLAHCQNIKIDHLNLLSVSGIAIRVRDESREASPTTDIKISHNQMIAAVHAIDIRVRDDRAGNNQLQIDHNQIAMLDNEAGRAGIFCLGDEVLIERNRVIVVPPPRAEEPEDPRDPDDPTIIIPDPCEDPRLTYNFDYPIFQFFYQTLRYVQSVFRINLRFPYQAQGGIQIGSTSERVRIIGNEIIGGWGHGITLGHLPEAPRTQEEMPDVLREVPFQEFNNAYGPASYQARRRGYAERWDQDLVSNYMVARFNSVLYEISIEENRMHDMGLCGIGVASQFHIERIGLSIRVEDLVIYRNTITKCAQWIPEEIPGSMFEQMGFGGIALSSCELANIQENRIEENGLSYADPICGIFILLGEKIEVSNNRILNNGPRIDLVEPRVRSGARGGIVIMISFKDLEQELSGEQERLASDGVPAIKIHNNIVTQPLGQALLLFAMGPVSVVGNQFTTQETDPGHELSLLAGAVLILNLGFSKDLIGSLVLPRIRKLANLDYMASPDRISRTRSPLLRNLQFLPNGATMFANNQTTLDLRNNQIDLGISAQLIVSLDDISYTGNQSECASYLSPQEQLIDLVLINTILAGFTVRSNDNRFQEGLSLTFYSLFSLGIMNTAMSNQSTHCLLVSGSKKAEQANLVLRDAGCRERFEGVSESLAINQYGGQMVYRG